MSQSPSFGSIDVFLRHPFEVSFGYEVRDLTKNVFALVHNRLLYGYLSLITFSKVRQAFCYANI